MNKNGTTQIRDCTFTGVHYDAKAVEAISTIAMALLRNAEGLVRLATVLNASNVKIETMVKVEQATEKERARKKRWRDKKGAAYMRNYRAEKKKAQGK